MFLAVFSVSNLTSYISYQYSYLEVKSAFIPTSPKSSESQITEHMPEARL